MRRTDDNTLKRSHLDPTIRRAAACEHQRMHTVPFDHREFKIATKRSR